MRNAIIEQIYEEMKIDKTIFFLTADMGINLVEKIEISFPDRFLNVGIAEQNLIGIASGLINLNFKVIVYTISNFLVHRCFEQIRNDISLHKKPILMIGTSCGYDNASLGPTHHVIDDWGYIKNLPNFEVYCPFNTYYLNNLTKKLLNQKESIYLRIPKINIDTIGSQKDYEYLSVKKYENIILTYGSVVEEILPLYKMYGQSLLVFNKLHPLDQTLLLKILENYKKIFIVEEHFSSNGLYDSICKMFINSKSIPEIVSVAPNDYNLKIGKNNKYLFELNNMDLKSVKNLIEEK